MRATLASNWVSSTMGAKSGMSICIRILTASTLLTTAILASAQTTAKPVELSVPFPKSSPRPSAAVVYCTPAINNELAATDSQVASKSFVGWKARVRIMFTGSDILLSVADVGASAQDEYKNPTRYSGTRPEPSDFAGNVYFSSDGNGQATVLAMNRDTGTLIWSTVSAGSAGGGYPSISTAFYVCGQRTP